MRGASISAIRGLLVTLLSSGLLSAVCEASPVSINYAGQIFQSCEYVDGPTTNPVCASATGAVSFTLTYDDAITSTTQTDVGGILDARTDFGQPTFTNLSWVPSLPASGFLSSVTEAEAREDAASHIDSSVAATHQSSNVNGSNGGFTSTQYVITLSSATLDTGAQDHQVDQPTAADLFLGLQGGYGPINLGVQSLAYTATCLSFDAATNSCVGGFTFDFAPGSSSFFANVTPLADTEVPEPASMILFGTGAAALAARRRRTRA